MLCSIIWQVLQLEYSLTSFNINVLVLEVILINGKNSVSVSILISVSTKIHGIGLVSYRNQNRPSLISVSPITNICMLPDKLN